MSQPIFQELPFCNDSERLFERLRLLPGAVWLDSGKPRALQGRFDIISALPQIAIVTRNGETTVTEGDTATVTTEDPFATAWQTLESQGLIDRRFAHIPFVGGLIGYFSYDLGRGLHRLPASNGNGLPDMALNWYGWAVVINHQASRAWLVAHPACKPAILEQVRALLAGFYKAENCHDKNSDNNFELTSPFCPDLDKTAYLQQLSAIKQHINNGDCYQVNYALRHRATYRGDPWQAYQKLRRASPSPYSAYLNWDGTAILSCSPERFLKVSHNQVETKPIKGTIARGQTLQQDQDNAISLQNSKKDRAENLMIVDLMRNDLSRNCAISSVHVPKLFALESFANVHHLVSTVTGTLAPGKNALDLLRDSFPGGSITGAPKKRAMEIIDQLESANRGMYCGSLGYISATGRMDTNIAIRTMVASNGLLQCWGGGGIVADSVPENEYDEALQKVHLLMESLASKPIG